MVDKERILEAVRESEGFPVEVEGVEYGADWVICDVRVFDAERRLVGEERIVRRAGNPKSSEKQWIEMLDAFDCEPSGAKFTFRIHVHNHPGAVYRFEPIRAPKVAWTKVFEVPCECD